MTRQNTQPYFHVGITHHHILYLVLLIIFWNCVPMVTYQVGSSHWWEAGTAGLLCWSAHRSELQKDATQSLIRQGKCND